MDRKRLVESRSAVFCFDHSIKVKKTRSPIDFQSDRRYFLLQFQDQTFTAARFCNCFKIASLEGLRSLTFSFKIEMLEIAHTRVISASTAVLPTVANAHASVTSTAALRFAL